MSSPRVSVVIVGYNSRRYLDRCLASVLDQPEAPPYEIVFVDNASTDGSAELIQRSFSSVRVVASDRNRGFADGSNLGARAAEGDLLVFLNPDTEVAPGWLTELTAPLDAAPDLGLATSRILLMHDRQRINACGNEVSLGGLAWCRGAGRAASDYAADADVPAISGCACAIRASVFWMVGGFDPDFFMYLEDTDLSWRVRQAGYRCRFVARSIVYHDYSFALSAPKFLQTERNRYRMLAKNLSWSLLLALAPTLLLTEMLTWGFAVTRGPAYVAAKSRATVWALSQLLPQIRWRTTAHAWQTVAAHRAAPAIAQVMSGRLARVADRLFAPCYATAAAFFAGLCRLRLAHAGPPACLPVGGTLDSERVERVAPRNRAAA